MQGRNVEKDRGGMKVVFNPELEVPSKELCKKLKELGFPQEGGGWYWYSNIKNATWRLIFEPEPFSYEEDIEECIKAPTCRELGEWLIKKSILLELGNLFIDYDEAVNKWTVCYGKVGKTWVWDDTEPNARAKMIIFLAENGYLKFQK